MDTLISKYDNLLGVTGSHRDRAFRSWREGWVLQHAFEPLDVVEARLVAEGVNLPDAELRLAGNSIIGVEITEGMSSSHQPWRREPPGTYRDGDVAQWRKNVAEIPHLLEAAARRKVSKPYAACSCLLVYLGTGATWGIADPEIQEAILDFRSRYLGKFADVRVLWGMTIYSIGATAMSTEAPFAR